VIPVESSRAATFSALATAARSALVRGARRGTAAYGSGRLTATRRGSWQLAITPDRAARTALAAGSTLHLTITVTYRPRGGGKATVSTLRATVSLALARGAADARPARTGTVRAGGRYASLLLARR